MQSTSFFVSGLRLRRVVRPVVVTTSLNPFPFVIWTRRVLRWGLLPVYTVWVWTELYEKDVAAVEDGILLGGAFVSGIFFVFRV